MSLFNGKRVKVAHLENSYNEVWIYVCLYTFPPQVPARHEFTTTLLRQCEELLDQNWAGWNTFRQGPVLQEKQTAEDNTATF